MRVCRHVEPTSCLHVVFTPQAAVRYVAKCRLMKGPWVQMNHMTEREEYLHIEQQHVDKFIKSWSLVSSRAVKDKGEADTKGDTKDDTKGDTKGDTKDKGKVRKAVAKGDTKGDTKGNPNKEGGENEGGSAGKKAKVVVDDLMGKALRIKTKYHNVVGSCQAFKNKAAKDEARHQNSQMFAGVRLMCSNKCIAKFVFIYEVAF